jgi:hypothetical protein
MPLGLPSQSVATIARSVRPRATQVTEILDADSNDGRNI